MARPHRPPHLRSLALATPLALLAACSTAPTPAPTQDPDTDAADTADVDAPDAPPDAPPDDDPDAAPDVADDPGDGRWHMPRRALCEGAWGAPRDLGPLADAALREASGLVASPTAPGVLWSHNDSGDAARLFALGLGGEALGHLNLLGVEAVDFEDLAVSACPDGSGPCLWVADMGNNLRLRDDQVIYAVPEPPIASDAPIGERGATPLLRLPITFEGANPDAEALVVAPEGDALYVLEKRDEATFRVFAATGPFLNDQLVVLRPIAEVNSPGAPISHGFEITGADLHPSGLRLAIRLYVGSFDYRLQPGQTLADLPSITPLRVAAGPLSEPQGEAIAWDHEGTGLITVSEATAADQIPVLHAYPCR